MSALWPVIPGSRCVAVACRTWSRAVRLLSSLAAEERRGLVIVASISQSVGVQLEQVLRVGRIRVRVVFDYDLGDVKESLDESNEESKSQGERDCRMIIAGQIAEVVQEKYQCRTRALPCYVLSNVVIAGGHYYIDHLQQQRAAAASRPQALGKRVLETRQFHVLPGTCLSPAAIGPRRDPGQASGPTARVHCWQTGMSSDLRSVWGLLTCHVPLFLWLLDLHNARLRCLSRQGGHI